MREQASMSENQQKQQTTITELQKLIYQKYFKRMLKGCLLNFRK